MDTVTQWATLSHVDELAHDVGRIIWSEVQLVGGIQTEFRHSLCVDWVQFRAWHTFVLRVTHACLYIDSARLAAHGDACKEARRKGLSVCDDDACDWFWLSAVVFVDSETKRRVEIGALVPGYLDVNDVGAEIIEGQKNIGVDRSGGALAGGRLQGT